MRIFLVGMMGAGKTTLGRQLAKQLGCAFVDLDAYIEQREGKTISRLFEQQGQEQFRELERLALVALVQAYEQAVIATGGGTPCFFDNMAYINRKGISIFLDVPAAKISERLLTSEPAVRPLVAGKSAEELPLFISRSLARRREFYEQAQYTLSGKNIDLAVLAALVNNM